MTDDPSYVTRISDQVDDLHGEMVADPYRWLENTDDPETRRWITHQNARAEGVLAKISSRDEIRTRLTELWDFPRYGVPFERGGLWFQNRNTGLQNQPVLYVSDAPGDQGRVLLDPNLLSSDGTIALSAFAVTEDGSLMAYATSEAGSDWMAWRVRDVGSGVDCTDLVRWSKYGVAAWLPDRSGFYYNATEPPESGDEFTSPVGLVRIFFHRLGTSQADDDLIFEAPDEPEWVPHAMVTQDGRFLLISISRGTGLESRILVIDLSKPERTPTALVDGFSCRASVITNVDRTFYVITDDHAERQRIVAIDLDDPSATAWREVVPERKAVLIGAEDCGGRFACHYLADACSRVAVFELNGTHVCDLPLPTITSILSPDGGSGIEGRSQSSLLHFELNSFTDSGSLWSHSVDTGETRLVRPPAAAIEPEQFLSEQVFVTASDGAAIPLFLTRKHGVAESGSVPVLLYGYGGFGAPVTPRFSPAEATFVERGGLLAVAALRGGGEYGRSWHDAGRLEHKQRVFDDFCDCARWLVTSGWSRPDRIGINGRSNGGLLVGACLTQHPELFGAAVPEVGVLDMLRFHRFTIGWAWKSDYGDPDDPAQYPWIHAYSPLHNVKPGTEFPPVLITTGDHDDRVVPGHSFKFAATLQAAQATSAHPAIIRIETSAGHGAGKPTDKAIAERADMLAFLESALGSS